MSAANPAVQVDLVADLGATVTLALAEDNDFTLAVTYMGEEPGRPSGTSSEVSGTGSSTEILTLRNSPTSEWQFEIQLDGDALTEADTSFDFGGNGTLEDAKLSLDLSGA